MKDREEQDQPRKEIQWNALPSLLYSKVKDSELMTSSVMIAYYFLLSLFPLLVTFVTLLPLFHINPDTTLSYFIDILPPQVYEAIQPVVDGFFSNTTGGMLSLSVVATLWSASRGIRHIQSGIDSIYGVGGARLYFFQRLVSVGTLVLIVMALVSSTVLFTFGETFLMHLAEIGGWNTGIVEALNRLKWPIPILVLTGTLVVIYITSPSLQLRVKDVLPGALLSTLFLLFSVQIVSLYIKYSVRLVSAYSTLSSMFVLLLWLRLTAAIILAGAAVNAALHELLYGPPNTRQNRAETYIRQKFGTVLGRFATTKTNSPE